LPATVFNLSILPLEPIEFRYLRLVRLQAVSKHSWGQAVSDFFFDLVSRLARNSNEYVRRHILPKDCNRRLQGQPYVNVTTEEMYHFFGIILQISLSSLDWGGYEAYFSSNNRRVLGKEMQIRAAFHPEDRVADLNGDKCFQLRHVITKMNQAAVNTKFIGGDLTFDKGGIGSWHRLNHVRQYNKDMACSRTYFIHHIDVYQGANANNVGIHRAVRLIPTTQKVCSSSHKDASGGTWRKAYFAR
jgi:hypothetical protein